MNETKRTIASYTSGNNYKVWVDEVHSLSLYIIKVPVGSFRFHESLTAINKDLRLADLFMHDVTNNNSNNIGTNNSKIKKL